MTNKLIICGCAVLVVVASGCKRETSLLCPSGSSPIKDDVVVAKVEGEPITAEAFYKATRDNMKRMRRSIYRIEQIVLDKLISQRLMAVAAKKAGISVEEYEKKMIDEKVKVPAWEVKVSYDAHKEQGKITEPFDEVKDDIVTELKRSKRVQVKRELVAKLRDQAEVKIMLDAPRIEVEVEGWPSLGPHDAPITIINFADYQGLLSVELRSTIRKLLDRYEGKVKYVFRDFPHSFYRDEQKFRSRDVEMMHPDSQKAHEAAHCAGDQGKYFEYNKKLFKNQDKLKVDDLKGYALALGLNMAEFNPCLESGKHAARIKRSRVEAENADIGGPPMVVINGIRIPGVHSLRHYKEIIEGELEKQKK